MGKTLDMDELNRISVEVGTGKKPAKPDTPEMARVRAALKVDYEKAEKGGYQIQIPGEL